MAAAQPRGLRSPAPPETHQDQRLQLLPLEPALRGQQLALALEQLQLQLVRLLRQLTDLLSQRVLLLQAPRVLCVQLLPRGDGLRGRRGGGAGRPGLAPPLSPRGLALEGRDR